MKPSLKLAAAAVAAFALSSPCANASRGDIFFFNNSNNDLAPYFKFDCLGTGWINFGGVGANSEFGWGQLVDDGCEVEFTYTLIGAPPPQDPVKGTLRTRLTYDSQQLYILTVGTGVLAREMEGPGERGR